MRLFPKPLIFPIAAAFLTGAWLLPTASVNAQQQSSPPATTAQPSNLSEEKLDAAAAALEQVANLKDEYEERIASASPPDREKITQEANSALERAVTDQGLSLEEYNSIIVLAQNDAGVRKRLLDRMDQEKKQ